MLNAYQLIRNIDTLRFDGTLTLHLPLAVALNFYHSEHAAQAI